MNNPKPWYTEPYVITFEGGDMDGLVIDSSTANKNERRVAWIILKSTNMGEAGRGVKEMPINAALSGTLVERILKEAVSKTKITNLRAYFAGGKKVVDGVHHVRIRYTTQPTGLGRSQPES